MTTHSTHQSVGTTDSRGSILLIALVILGAVTLSTIYLSLVLLSEIRSTRYADNSIISYYVAETASENALWRLKQSKAQFPESLLARQQFLWYANAPKICAAENGGAFPVGGIVCPKRCTFTDIACEVDNDCMQFDTCTTVSGADLERTYIYTALATEAADFTVYDIAQNAPVFTDIYDPAKEGLVGRSTDVAQLNIDWYVPTCANDESSAKLEITYTPVDIDDLEPGSSSTAIHICGCNDSSIDPVDGRMYKCAEFWENPVDPFSTTVPVTPSSFYRISFRSLDTPISKLVMTAFDVNGDPVPIPSQIDVQATGTYRESQSKVRLRTLWKDTLSGIFNYVIFSEDSLIKDTKGDTSTPYDSMCGFYTGATIIACSETSATYAPEECSVTNTLDDNIDGALTTSFCFDTINGEVYTDGDQILQTDAGSCNALCNGKTFCGDGTIQSPNGVGDGFAAGNEECDEGPGNSDIAPLHCRTDCRDPYCGDNVIDSGPYSDPITGIPVVPPYSEACDNGVDNAADQECTATCQLTFCGDDTIQTPNGFAQTEQCDDGLSNVASCGAPGECLASSCEVCP